MLSLIVVVYNMRREALRSLFTLSASFQRGIAADEYEIIVVENGSQLPLDPGTVRSLGDNIRYEFVDFGSPSPARAINHGAGLARGDWIGVIIDGARLASPGLLRWARAGLAAMPRSLVTTVSLDLGPDMQLRTSGIGYDTEAEDDLLDSIDWRTDGYRLFRIAAFGSACDHGWFGRIAESNALFMSRTLFKEIGGYAEVFDIPAGGLVNHDTMIRAARSPETTVLRLLGEATFHQIHAGSGSSRPLNEALTNFRVWREHYRAVRGAAFEKPAITPVFFGELHPETLPLIARSGQFALDRLLSGRAVANGTHPALKSLASSLRDHVPPPSMARIMARFFVDPDSPPRQTTIEMTLGSAS
ncbi:MAG: glycosyltransferase [Rhodospirillaceae bacterium]